MKLESKHIVLYYPHKLNVCMNGLIKHDLIIEEVLSIREYSGVVYFNNHCLPINGISWKPILRQLSELDNYKDEILIRWGGGLPEKAKEKWVKSIIDEMKYTAYNALRYDFIEFMAEHHFDFMGLIPASLAVDINTLNKPKDSTGGYGGC